MMMTGRSLLLKLVLQHIIIRFCVMTRLQNVECCDTTTGNFIDNDDIAPRWNTTGRYLVRDNIHQYQCNNPLCPNFEDVGGEL